MAKLKRPWFYFFANRLLRQIFGIILQVDIRGLENVPREGPLIVAISHSSFVDPVVTGVYMPRDVIPMAKVEAFEYPLLGQAIRWYGAFGVRRGQVDVSAFKTALQILRQGEAMVIAPEGHRSDSGALQRGKEGAIMLSLRSGAPILPVAVWGGKPLFSNLQRLRRTKMWFYVGKPVIPVFIGVKPTREQITAMSDELMERIAEMMPVEVRGYYADPGRVTTQYLKNHDGANGEQAPAPTAKKEKEVITD